MTIFQGENLITLIQSIGYIGVFAIVFAESGLLIGFFLPGDSLLFTAGFLASQNYLNIYWLIIILMLAAIIGDNFGYLFGKKVGPKLFKKTNSLLFHKDNLLRAEKFYEKYGPMTIIIARFIPVVRTFAPIVAGIGKMKYKTFLLYNIAGGALWTLSLTLAGFYLSRIIPDVEKHLELIIAIIIIISIIPPIYHLVKEKLTKKV
ncbi:MAG: VTT domain-containing protein [Candidatus Berkelbacteria bacterium]